VRRTLRTTVAAAVGGLVAGGLLALPTDATAAATTLTAAVSRPVAAERVAFSGRLPSRYERPVKLQVRTSYGWKTLARSTTAKTGGFKIVAAMPKGKRTFRAYAPKTARSSAVATRTLTLSSAGQSASLDFVSAAIGQTKSGTANLTPVLATFTPVRSGREVALQRYSSGRWSTVQTLRQDSSGRALFMPSIASGETRPYRVMAKAFSGAAAVYSAQKQPSHWTRIFNDDFNGSTLDTSKWSHRYVGKRGAGRQCSETSPDMVSVSNGKARLTVAPIPADKHKKTPAECPYGEWYNGHFSTMGGKFDFEYGIMAARMRFPHAPGQHGALWSQPEKPTLVPGDPTSSGAEIDVVEYFGDNVTPFGPVHNVYWRDADNSLTSATSAPAIKNLLQYSEDWSDDYHVYSVEWTPSEYIFRVDGHETFRTDRGVSGTKQYVILSLLTSDWEMFRLKTSALNPMAVDWVRVWQR
jgi:beta-glucanase (GH16 family)